MLLKAESKIHLATKGAVGFIYPSHETAVTLEQETVTVVPELCDFTGGRLTAVFRDTTLFWVRKEDLVECDG